MNSIQQKDMDDLDIWATPNGPADIFFHSDWWYKNYGIDFGKKYYFDPEYRMRVNKKKERILYERFGDLGLGSPNPSLVPWVSGIDCVTLPAIFGCEIEFRKGEQVWFSRLDINDEEAKHLETPTVEDSYPMSQIIEQGNYLKRKYGEVKGMINWQGVQNLAYDIRGNQLFMDYYEKPNIAQKILQVSAEAIIRVVKCADKLFGKPKVYTTSNCTVQMISPQIYEDYLLTYDNILSDELTDSEHGFGIHYCGKNMEKILSSLKKVKNLKFLEVGWGSDVGKVRRAFPNLTISARISPVRLRMNSKKDIEKDVRKLMEDGASFVRCAGVDSQTPDENIRTMFRTAQDYT